MPIYEYRCSSCGLRQSIFFRGFSTVASEISCRRCGSTALQRLVSRFFAAKSEDAQLESLADPSNLGGVDENDPRSVARWARKMARETGEDMGSEFDEMVARLEAGEMPDEGEAGMGPESDGDDLLD
ncbi:MAG: FmdB family zinc ribbon protein [Chloroflexota bacterium]